MVSTLSTLSTKVSTVSTVDLERAFYSAIKCLFYYPIRGASEIDFIEGCLLMDKSDFSSSKVSNSGISLRQHIAVQQLVLTGSISAAAAAAGVTTKTIHTWQKQPSFQEALRFAELQALEEYLRGVTRLS